MDETEVAAPPLNGALIARIDFDNGARFTTIDVTESMIALWHSAYLSLVASDGYAGSWQQFVSDTRMALEFRPAPSLTLIKGVSHG